MAGMSRWLLAGGFVIAGFPFTGIAIRSAAVAVGGEDLGRLPNWYGWIFAACAVVVAVLFAAAAAAAATDRVPWRVVVTGSLAALVVVGVATLGSLYFVIPLAMLAGISYLLKRRTSPGTA
jgi:hypothetical protein